MYGKQDINILYYNYMFCKQQLYIIVTGIFGNLYLFDWDYFIIYNHDNTNNQRIQLTYELFFFFEEYE